MKFKFTLLIVIYFSIITNAQYQLQDVVITAGRNPSAFSELTRNVYVIDIYELQQMPVNSLQDILQYIPGVDVRQRGIEGVQADISIRGGTFDQTLIMIDGIKISDPQTGHHNLNLVITPDNIEKIEVLKGQGSKSFGANAFSGVINFITRKESSRKIFLQASGGQHGYYEGVLNASYSSGILNNSISLSKKKSDGYRHNTNFDQLNFSYNSSLNFQNNKVNFLLGYNDNEFGANGFYSDRFPNQWEHTRTKFLSTSSEFRTEQFTLIPKIYWRRNDDRFLLNFENPSFYQNTHQTNIYGTELEASLKTDLGITSFGGEYTQDKIESSNLGIHSRYSKGVFAEQKVGAIKNIILVAGIFAYDYPSIGWKYSPGLDIAYNISPGIKLYGSVGKAFRVPTYTELFYSDAASQGNENLRHEETLNYELGLNFFQSPYSFELNFFRKEGKNIIDWVRNLPEDKWTARNIADVNTNGIEINASLFPEALLKNLPVYRFRISYTFLNLDKNFDEVTSRYALDHLKHQMIIDVSNYLPFNIKQNWKFRYESRVNLEKHFITDTQLSYEINDLIFFMNITNLFNTSYRDITNIPLPGRWITGGVNLNLNL